MKPIITIGILCLALVGCNLDTNGYNYKRTGPDKPVCVKKEGTTTIFYTC